MARKWTVTVTIPSPIGNGVRITEMTVEEDQHSVSSADAAFDYALRAHNIRRAQLLNYSCVEVAEEKCCTCLYGIDCDCVCHTKRAS